MSHTGLAVSSEELSATVLYEAIDVLANYLDDDIPSLSGVTKKVAVVNYTQSEDLPESAKAYLLKKLEQSSRSNEQTPVRILQCMKCLAVRAEAQGDEIFIKKGISDKAELAAAMKDLGITKYADVNLTNAGRYLILQMSVVNQDGIIEWSKEYKTPMSAYNDSQWIIGADVQSLSYSNADFPSSQAFHAYVGQRLFGVGSAGLAIQTVPKTKNKEVSAYNTYSGYFELSHNELFKAYWDFFQLSYLLELGMTDFNKKQQIAETVGIKMMFGNYFSMRLAAQANQFISTPKDDSDVYNPANPAGPIMKNNEPLPMRYLVGVGVEL